MMGIEALMLQSKCVKSKNDTSSFNVSTKGVTMRGDFSNPAQQKCIDSYSW